jgi:N-acetylglutamate synthase-like GNAT family acetyltransferase
VLKEFEEVEGASAEPQGPVFPYLSRAGRFVCQAKCIPLRLRPLTENQVKRIEDGFRFRKTGVLCENAEPEGLSRSIQSLLTEVKIGIDDNWNAYFYWIAEWNCELVGCSSLIHLDRVAIFHSLAVKKAYRHRGIGSRLTELRLQEARASGDEVVVLMTMFWNVNFYRKLRFETTSRKFLPNILKDHPMIFDVAFQRSTPMIQDLRLGR